MSFPNPGDRQTMRSRTLAAALALLSVFLAVPAIGQIPRPSPGHPQSIFETRVHLQTAKFPRTITVCASGCDYATLALAYTYVGTQTHDATHHWQIIVWPDATITSPGSQPTFTSVTYALNTPSTAAACSNGQVQTYVSTTNSWACGSATTGGVTGPGTSVAGALASWFDTGGGALQAVGSCTLAGNPGLAASQVCSATTGLIFEGLTGNASEGLLASADVTADRTWTLPDASGTISLIDGKGTTTTFAVAAGGANVSEVTITVVDAAAATVAAVHHLDVWLSDSATCAGATGTTASGTVTAKAASGRVVSTFIAKKELRVETLATGVFILEITDTAKTGFFVCATGPASGKAAASAQLVTGNYGT